MKGRRIFRKLIPLEEARRLLYEHFTPKPLGVEEVPLTEAYNRVLGEDVISGVDVPGFDRAAMDGFAVRAEDTFGADEENPVRLVVIGQVEAGEAPRLEVCEGEAVEVATGAPIPRGADAVVMVEYTQPVDGEQIEVFKSVTPGENVLSAGFDIRVGELILRRGERITPREIGVLAAVGLSSVKVFRKPRVAIISTGKELTRPGEPLEFGKIYDINSSSLAGAVVESGGEPVQMGISSDDPEEIAGKIKRALSEADLVLTSGSTSAGAGDVMYRILNKLGEPGVIVHGLAVKPGKPTIIAIIDGKPVFGLPGYPTSALTIFNLLVKPVILQMAGSAELGVKAKVRARMAFKVFPAKGRREFLPVHIIRREDGSFLAYPVLTGSGAITTLAMADGFIEIPEGVELLSEGEEVSVNLFSSEVRPADLVIMGSHCIGVDILLRCLRERRPSFKVKVVNVGSIGGINAVRRGEADIAGIHLLDEETGGYNIPFLERYNLSGRAVLVRGYKRQQGFMVKKGNPKGIRSFRDLLRDDVTFINRNVGSGTRVLIDMNLTKVSKELGISVEEVRSRIRGYNMEARSHSAVASMVLHDRADVGIGIKTAAELHGLDFIPITDEEYDFLIPKERLNKGSVKDFLEILRSDGFRRELSRRAPGLTATEETGRIIWW